MRRQEAFSLSVCLFVLRSEPSQPQRGVCCGGTAYFGLSREASAQGRAAPNTALFVLQEGAFVAILSRWEQAKELMVVPHPPPRALTCFPSHRPEPASADRGGVSKQDPTSSRYVQSSR